MTSIPDKLYKYELVIGLEVHIQLATNTKIFSSDSAAFGGEPNSHVSIVSLGLPGSLPYLNSTVIDSAIKLGLATNCSINLENRFDRKNYFYADLPKGYQITQDALPICKEGFIEIKTKAFGNRQIRINRIHMEEDAGKSMHDQDLTDSLIDLNRAGVPLLELVSEPDLRSAEEAAQFISEVRKIVRFLGVSDGNMEEGSLRCDANISIRIKNTTAYGNRCEVKNVNSMRNLQRAITYEFNRQVDVVENGGSIEQQTLNFDAATGITSPLRSKELANDYRYFPEPDLLPVRLTEEYIKNIQASLPELPQQLEKRFINELGLSEYDANLLASEKEISSYFNNVIKTTSDYKAAANWILGPVRSLLNETGLSISQLSTKPSSLADLINLISTGKISFTSAVQQVFPAMQKHPDHKVIDLVTEMNLLISVDQNELDNLVDEVLNLYPDKIIEYRKGKKAVLGLFMGEFMKRSKGKADPKTANSLIVKKLEETK
ncbi:MAG TPA: Asp-tRNA(Asn)/Glu-tRNA(Gln) amidotransferase subunit GatB [Sphingobacteriaceae bacterium]|nr:Asp-tRNA(Asn)/Glu-tRNA(Gln) amidotransferase subunit GatB [Sphingobacteriaceae bacterium]